MSIVVSINKKLTKFFGMHSQLKDFEQWTHTKYL